MNIGSVQIITKVEVQGRFGNGQGREFAEQYKLQYWRPGLQYWPTYKNGRGEEVRFCFILLIILAFQSYLQSINQLFKIIFTIKIL